MGQAPALLHAIILPRGSGNVKKGGQKGRGRAGVGATLVVARRGDRTTERHGGVRKGGPICRWRRWSQNGGGEQTQETPLSGRRPGQPGVQFTAARGNPAAACQSEPGQETCYFVLCWVRSTISKI